MGSPAKKPVSPHFWVPSTYFAEGFPYSVVNSVAEVFFQQMGASLAAVGLTSLFHLPWNLKFFWAPLLDQIGTKKAWLVAMQLLGAGLLGLLAPVSHLPSALTFASVVFLLCAIVSATNDVAIDGYYMEALDLDQQSKFVGYRAMAYKVSSLLVRGPLLGLAGLASWAVGFAAMALVLLGLGLLHAFFLARDPPASLGFRQALLQVVNRPWRLLGLLVGMLVCLVVGFLLRGPIGAAIEGSALLSSISTSGWIAIGLSVFLMGAIALLPLLRARVSVRGAGPMVRPLLHLLERPRIKAVLLFVVLFRTGESFLQKMKFPFLSEELGLTVSGYALASGTVGVVASFVGTFVGGALISRDGLRRWIWPFLLAQNVLNLLYAGLAVWGTSGGPDHAELDVTLVSSTIIAIEEFGAGLGTAVFMVYLMRLCHPAHRAAHFAVLTALMSLSFTFAGSLSGFLAQATGFSTYFLLTFAFTVPMMLLVPRVVTDEVLDWARSKALDE